MEKRLLPVHLFDHKFQYDEEHKVWSCPRCHRIFGITNDRSNRASTRPYILTCGHNICEGCIYSNIYNLTCAVCLKPMQMSITILTIKNFKLHNFFDLNFFIIGKLFVTRTFRNPERYNNALQNPMVASRQISQEEIIVKCTECDSLNAKGKCKQCKVPFCHPCFSEIHKHSKALQLHTLRIFNANYIHPSPMVANSGICIKHGKKKFNYCPTCDCFLCVICAKDEHRTHGWRHIQSQNNMVIGDLNSVFEVIDKTRDSLSTAVKDVKKINTQLENHAKETMENISSYFVRLHSLLQVEERRIGDHFHQEYQTTYDTLNNAYKTLDKSEEILNKLEMQLKYYKENIPSTMLVSDIIKTSNEQIEKLLCQVDIDGIVHNNPFIFEIHETMDGSKTNFSQWYNFAYKDPKLTVRISPLKKVVEDWDSLLKIPDDGAQSSICDISNEFEQSICSTNAASINKIPPSIINQVPMLMRTNPIVRISNYISPNNFYIQPEQNVPELCNLNEKYVKCSHSEDIPKTILEGHLYVAFLVTDNQWYRAMVNKILPKALYKVFLVDVGMEIKVCKDSLREIDDDFIHIPFLAIRCAMYNLLPAGIAWTHKVNNSFIRITQNRLLEVSFYNLTEDQIFGVDLRTMGKRSFSLREHFLNAGLARELSDGGDTVDCERMGPVACINDPNPAISEQSNDKELKRTPIRIIYINNPSEFYIQLLDMMPGIIKFQKHIQSKQNAVMRRCPSRAIEKKRLLKDWNEGEHCLAWVSMRFSKTGLLEYAKGISDINTPSQWYRGIIVGSYKANQNSESIFTVFLRDIGVTVGSMTFRELYPICENLDVVANSAICCHLACVSPTGGLLKWSTSAIDFFKAKTASYDALFATLHGEKSITSSMPIILWGSKIEPVKALTPNRLQYFCINNILIVGGLAHKEGNLDTSAYQMNDLMKVDVASNEISLNDWIEQINKPPFLRALETPLYMDQYCYNYSKINTADNALSVAQPSKIVSNPLDSKILYPPPPAWLKSKIIDKMNFVGYPTYVDFDGTIYLHESNQNDKLKGLRFKIKKFVDKRFPLNLHAVPYEPGQACIAMYHLDKNYYRAIIKEKISQNEFNVYFIDYGNVESIDIKNLLPYAPYRKLEAFASTYIIDGICPKNGAAKHSIEVLDIIHNLIVEKFVNVRVIGNSLPTGERKKCKIRVGANDLKHFLTKDNHYADEIGIQNVEEPLQLKNVLDDLAVENVEVASTHDENNKNNDVDISLEQLRQTTCNDSDFDLMDINECISNLFNPTNFERNQQQRSCYEPPPPTKKRMFDMKEYKDLHLAKMYDIEVEIDDTELNIEEQKCIQDYWSTKDLSFDNDSHDYNKENKLNDGILDDQQSANRFYQDKFYPADTSSVITHISGYDDTFPAPQLPNSITEFYCTVVNISNPITLQIVPLLKEFAYRDSELQRRIQTLAQTAPMLTVFEPKAICLAYNTEDKQWYRALIRSYNRTANVVDVQSVDYFNVKTVNIKHLKTLPLELTSFPLRTFAARLAGVQPNPQKRARDVLFALKGALNPYTKLYARLSVEEKDSNSEAHKNLELTTKPSPLLVRLYKDPTATEVIYEDLIKNDLYFLFPN